MDSKDVNAGKGSKVVYSYKYGRKLEVSIETANFDLSYIAAQSGSQIFVGLADVYKMNECVTLTAGVGTLAILPVSTTVGVELPSGQFVEVTPTASSIDLTAYGLTTESVKATYQFNTEVKRITIDAESNPMLMELILFADKCNNDSGKVADIEINVPRFQLDGNYEISLSPDGTATTNLNGQALAVEGEKCSDGSSVYAYITEVPTKTITIPVAEIVATPSTATIAVAGTQNISVLALRGGLYKPSQLTNTDCTFTSGTPATATVTTAGVITGVAAGTSVITVTYQGVSDTVSITVTA
jgi:hypothetical protein